jgi:hypothetical protein
MPLLLVSPVFSPGGAIPSEHTCDGADTSPPLNWSGVPEGTQSLGLIVDDPDRRQASPPLGRRSTSRPARPGSQQATARTGQRSDFA